MALGWNLFLRIFLLAEVSWVSSISIQRRNPGQGIGGVRLVQGDLFFPTSGRLEVFHDGAWGTVCDDDFSEKEAKVVCRGLGFTSGIVRDAMYYDQGAGPIWLDSVQCSGDESSLLECQHDEWGSHNCGHREDVGVDCDLSFRLVQSDAAGPSSGRLEVFFSGVWGTICDDGFGDAEATVACRNLGFTWGMARYGSHNGQGSGPIWLQDVRCRGEESSLAECSYGQWGITDCDHYEDVGVHCYDGDVRLARSDLSDQTSGRLEVFIGDSWGTVCDDNFGDEEATVACRSLGFASGIAQYNTFHGEGSGQVWLDEVTCTGDESHLSECAHSEWGITNCDHSEDVGVDCRMSNDVIHVEERREPTMRLVDGPETSVSSGRLEVFVSGVWGTVCDDAFGDKSATVVCRALGFTYGVERPEAFYGEGSGSIWLDDVRCEGHEASLLECGHSPIGTHDCDHSEDVGVECYRSEESVEEGALRLVDGPSESYGRLEVYHLHSWGSVCNTYFTDVDALVACRDLGFSYGVHYMDNHYGSADESVRIWMDEVACTGREARLTDCPRKDWGRHKCDHQWDVSVDCFTSEEVEEYIEEGSVRLVDGPNDWSGRLEVFHLNHWGTVANVIFDDVAATVVCRSLGYRMGIVSEYTPAAGHEVPVWLSRVMCEGYESLMTDCDYGAWGSYYAQHQMDVGIDCQDDEGNSTGG